MTNRRGPALFTATTAGATAACGRGHGGRRGAGALRGAGLTLGNEIDKLAANIALGRDAAGVHCRSDSVRGLFVGEQQALGPLRDYSRTYNERFDGFIVRKFNGEKVKIASGEAQPL